LEIFWKKFDPEKTKEYINKLRTSFHFNMKGGEIFDVGPDGSYWMLQGKTNGVTYTVNTWEQYSNANSGREVIALVDGVTSKFKTIDGKPFLLSGFYAIWKKNKNDVIELGESAIKEAPVTVHVEVKRSLLTIKDERREILVQCTL
jgi:hypothetical protein